MSGLSDDEETVKGFGAGESGAPLDEITEVRTLDSGPRRVGRFQIEERIAHGGMGEVFLAREIVAGAASRPAVVKLMRPHLEGQLSFTAMFVEEGEVALRLSHPHIAHVYDFGQQGGRVYIAMEWVHGVTLRELILRHRELDRPMELALALRIAADVAGALDYAHRRPRPVVHRDVSPTNIMVSFEGGVKLLDFGVATIVDADIGSDLDGIKGKVGYLSPEQCLGWSVDGRSDLFSLGVCLFEALTSSRLYKRPTEHEAFVAICDEPPPSLRSLRPDAPPCLESFLGRLMHKQVQARFPSGAAVQAALERCLFELGEPMGICAMREQMEALYPNAGDGDWDGDSAVALRASLLSVPPIPAGLPPSQTDEETVVSR